LDVALPAVPFLALLFLGFGGWHPTPRLGGLLVAWGIVLVPIAIAELSFLRDPTSYAAVVMVAPSKQVLERTIALWLDNFTPWRWPFARPEWYVRPSAVIPTAWMGRLAGGRIALSASRPHQDRSEEIGQITHISALVPKGSMLVLVGKELARPTARRRSPCGPLTFRRRRRGGTYNIARSFVASKFLILHIYFTPGRRTLPDNFDGSIRNDPRAWNVSRLGREA
jgi:hypothetical protein